MHRSCPAITFFRHFLADVFVSIDSAATCDVAVTPVCRRRCSVVEFYVSIYLCILTPPLSHRMPSSKLLLVSRANYF